MKESAIETIEHATYAAAREALRRLDYSGIELERLVTIITDAAAAATRNVLCVDRVAQERGA